MRGGRQRVLSGLVTRRERARARSVVMKKGGLSRALFCCPLRFCGSCDSAAAPWRGCRSSAWNTSAACRRGCRRETASRIRDWRSAGRGRAVAPASRSPAVHRTGASRASAVPDAHVDIPGIAAALALERRARRRLRQRRVQRSRRRAPPAPWPGPGRRTGDGRARAARSRARTRVAPAAWRPSGPRWPPSRRRDPRARSASRSARPGPANSAYWRTPGTGRGDSSIRT